MFCLHFLNNSLQRLLFAFSTWTLLVMTRSVHCFTLSRGGRAECDFGAAKTEQTQRTQSRTSVIRMTDSVNKVNYGPGYKKRTSDRRASINIKD